jgi:hypothetical protein
MTRRLRYGNNTALRVVNEQCQHVRSGEICDTVKLSLPIQRWPDFRKWDERSEFQLYEAAALWFDAEPRLPMWWRARWKFRRWRCVIAVGAVPKEPEGPGTASVVRARTIPSVTLHTRVHREALRMLAEQEGKKPLFLFPERRGLAGRIVSGIVSGQVR